MPGFSRPLPSKKGASLDDMIDQLQQQGGTQYLRKKKPDEEEKTEPVDNPQENEQEDSIMGRMRKLLGYGK